MTRVTWTDPLTAWTATAGGATETGDYRETNQDVLVLDPTHPFALVLDGMGSSPAGERAAVTGGDALCAALAEGPAAGESAEAHLRRALRSANDAVHALHEAQEFRGAGATAVLALLHAGRVFVAWAGDSLAYRVTRDHVEPLTWPHDFRTLCCRRHGWDEQEASRYFWKNVLVHYLGGELPDPIEVPSFAPQRGDRLILATDGVHSLTEPADLLAACRRHPDPPACTGHLVRHALGRGSRDNATCVVIAFDGEPPGPGSGPRS